MSLIITITTDIMSNGIDKFAKELQTPKENVQILVAFYKENIRYFKCENFEPKENISFKRILKTEFDVFGYESKATPFLKDSLIYYAEKYQTTIENISIFICKIDNVINLIVYKNREFIKTIPLIQHFEVMGIT